jgi:hypothetical protein
LSRTSGVTSTRAAPPATSNENFNSNAPSGPDFVFSHTSLYGFVDCGSNVQFTGSSVSRTLSGSKQTGIVRLVTPRQFGPALSPYSYLMPPAVLTGSSAFSFKALQSTGLGVGVGSGVLAGSNVGVIVGDAGAVSGLMPSAGGVPVAVSVGVGGEGTETLVALLFSLSRSLSKVAVTR